MYMLSSWDVNRSESFSRIFCIQFTSVADLEDLQLKGLPDP